jgi:hypothetical protein
MSDETQTTQDTQPATECHPQPPIVIGRMEIAPERAELSDERLVFGRLDYFPPDQLAKAMRGEYDAPTVAKTEEVEADHE